MGDNGEGAKPEQRASTKGSLLEWAATLESNGDISGRVQAEIDNAHAAVDATGRLADVVAKDNKLLIKDFGIGDRQQQLQTEQTGVRPSHTERVVHNLDRAGLHKEPFRPDVQEQVHRLLTPLLPASRYLPPVSCHPLAAS